MCPVRQPGGGCAVQPPKDEPAPFAEVESPLYQHVVQQWKIPPAKESRKSIVPTAQRAHSTSSVNHRNCYRWFSSLVCETPETHIMCSRSRNHRSGWWVLRGHCRILENLKVTFLHTAFRSLGHNAFINLEICIPETKEILRFLFLEDLLRFISQAFMKPMNAQNTNYYDVILFWNISSSVIAILAKGTIFWFST